MIYPTTNDKAAEERLDWALESVQFWGQRVTEIMNDLDGSLPEELGPENAVDALLMVERAGDATKCLAASVVELITSIPCADDWHGDTDYPKTTARLRYRGCALARELDGLDLCLLKEAATDHGALMLLKRTSEAVIDLFDSICELHSIIASVLDDSALDESALGAE